MHYFETLTWSGVLLQRNSFYCRHKRFHHTLFNGPKWMWCVRMTHWIVGLALLTFYQRAYGGSNGWDWVMVPLCLFWIINGMCSSCKWAMLEDWPSTRNAKSRSSPQTLHMPSQPIPIVPLEDSQSPFDPSAVLPAGRPRGCEQPLFGLPFQVTHSFLRT